MSNEQFHDSVRAIVRTMDGWRAEFYWDEDGVSGDGKTPYLGVYYGTFKECQEATYDQARFAPLPYTIGPWRPGM